MDLAIYALKTRNLERPGHSGNGIVSFVADMR